MIEFHADDYGLFLAQSKRILACAENGRLNGISIFPNGEELNRCLALLPKADLSWTVHLNLMQGKCLAPKTAVPLLVDSEGIFSIGFGQLLFCTLSGNRKAYKHQLKTELSSQIHVLLPLFQEAGMPLRIDGHAHWHMIPVVFDALMEVIQEEQLPVTYIRIPSEPLSVYLKNLFHILPIPPINIVKALLLRVLAQRNVHRWQTVLKRMDQKIFLGVLFSGCFDLKRMQAVLPTAEQLAENRNCGLELLFHPGSVQEPEDLAMVTNRNDRQFFTNAARAVEASCLMNNRT